MVDIRVGGKDYGSSIKELDFADLDGELDESGTRLTASGGGASGTSLPTRIFKGAGEISAWFGSPTLGNLDNWTCWNLTTNQGLGVTFLRGADFPDTWESVNVFVWTAGAAAATGDASFLFRDGSCNVSDGEALPAPAGTQSTVFAVAEKVVRRTQLAVASGGSLVLPVTTDDFLKVSFYRVSASDTLGTSNAVSVLGIELSADAIGDSF